MSPIRVGLVGLSTTTTAMAPGAWAWLAHFPYLSSSSEYKIVALANSTVKSAETSIAHYKLDPTTKAYGNPDDLASDPDVDLVVVCINVKKHYEIAKPALLAGKDVFVEWPLGASTAEAVELTALANDKDVKTVVGLQARADPVLLKIKEIVENGMIGKITSSTVIGNFGLPIDAVPADMAYYLDIKSGGNSFTISFGHFYDSFRHVLGDFTDCMSILKPQYPTIKLLDAVGKVVDSEHPKTSPDHMLVQGTLKSGALASISFRTATKPINGVGLRWLISGSEGEIEITIPETGWQFAHPETTLKIRRGKYSEQEDVEFRKVDGTEPEVSFVAMNTARLYEAFAKEQTEKYATFAQSLETHRALDTILQGSK